MTLYTTHMPRVLSQFTFVWCIVCAMAIFGNLVNAENAMKVVQFDSKLLKNVLVYAIVVGMSIKRFFFF